MMQEAAIAAGLEERKEEVAKKKRPFWASEILWEAISQRIENRKRWTRWSREIVLGIVQKIPGVVLANKIVNEFIDTIVTKTEDKLQREKAKKAVFQPKLIDLGNQNKDENEIEMGKVTHYEKDAKGEGKLGGVNPNTKKPKEIPSIWTGGGPPTVRKIKIPRKRKTKKEMEDQMKNDIKGGNFVKEWCQASSTKIEGSNVRKIKERLGMKEANRQNEKDERMGGRVSQLARLYEKDAIPIIKEKTLKRKDDSWIRDSGGLGCNNSPKRMKVGLKPGSKTWKFEKEDERQPKNNPSRDWDGGREKTGPGTTISTMIGNIEKKNGKLEILGEKKERDSKVDFNGSQVKEPKPMRIEGMTKTWQDTTPEGILDDQLVIISRGLRDKWGL